MTRTRSAVVSVVMIAALASVVSGVAGAAKGRPAPLGIHSASLVQNGQQLVWTVTMNGAFSAVGLKRDHRSLCLLLERHGVTHRLCVGRGPHRIALFYDSSKGWRVITAAISRTRPPFDVCCHPWPFSGRP